MEKPGKYFSIQHGDDLELPNEVVLDLMLQVFSRGACFHFRAKGLSMAPFIKDGDWITVQPLKAERSLLGKIVAYIQPGRGDLVVHRVIRHQGGEYLIQGDNHSGEPDRLNGCEAILGSVIAIKRQGREIKFGLGPERYLIALLGQARLLPRILQLLRGIKHSGR